MALPGGPRIRLDVPCDLAALVGTRAEIAQAASGWGFAGLADLDLVASELVTNAIVHGQTPSVATLRLLMPGHVELAVADGGPGSPHLRRTSDGDPTGRGLRIVDAVSTSWGIEDRAADGTTVWARLGSPP